MSKHKNKISDNKLYNIGNKEVSKTVTNYLQNKNYRLFLILYLF